MTKYIYDYFKGNHIIPNSQCGFRKGLGTSIALTNVLDDIFTAFDKNMISVLVLLDFSNAFDAINHVFELLVAKLHWLLWFQ